MAGGALVAAVHDDQVKWSVTYQEALWLAPIGRAVRVSLGHDGDNVVLDEQGHEVLRLTGSGNISRLDAGNMLAYKTTLGSDTSRSIVELIGVPVATMRQTRLGTIPTTLGGGLAADGSTVVSVVGREVAVYRID